MWDKVKVLSNIQKLTPRLRTAFAAACATRSLFMYLAWSKESGWGNSERMQKALELVWRYVEGELIDSYVLQSEAEAVYTLIPDTENLPSVSSSGALDAGLAVMYALQCAATDSNSDHAANAAEAAFVAFDIVRHNAGSTDTSLLDKEKDCQEKTIQILLGWGERPITRKDLSGY
jgi:uncharacterized protein YjaG (DUF416 family)